MSQDEVLKFLKKHPMKWFSCVEMERQGDVKNASVACRKLAKYSYGEVENSAEGFVKLKYRYNPNWRKQQWKLLKEY